ncbi:hypothetical protein [Bradyrhizobium sp. ARR65]|uniref:hypothetical protein n=1 Tax=Bradyrhizobium sp. ARR65 TaxID=1040989 RepID=UPI00054FBCF5|nr:hypothetical protein [Bradyrhizobium sp. ARR65]
MPFSRLEEQHGAGAGNQASTVLTDDSSRSKGLAMLIRSEIDEIAGEAALAVRPGAIAAASLPTLVIGGLLLTCP